MNTSVLYLSHNGLTEPLGRRQVLPYLVGLSARGWRFRVISFEKPSTATPDAVTRVASITRAAAIVWTPLRYHRWPPLASTGYDVVRGLAAGMRLGRGVALIHARSTVPALMARLLSVRLRVPWVFDLRGLLAEEYVDAGHWRRGGLRHRVTRWTERSLLGSADGVVTLTAAIVGRLSGLLGSRPARQRTAVIPCSVDPDDFHPSAAWRSEVRSELGWGDEPVLIYSGSLGSWYRLPEMLDFFESARRQLVDLRFLLLTPHATPATDALRVRRLTGVAAVRSLSPDEVPRHLAAGDAGICFLGPDASKIASSPTKFGEYLAAGLPVVTNEVGDARTHAAESVWILVDGFTEACYQRAAAKLATLLATPEASRTQARSLAQRCFALNSGVDEYERLYQAVLER